MSEAGEVPEVNFAGIESQGRAAARVGDLDALGALIRHTDEAQRLLLAWAQREDSMFRELRQETPTLKKSLGSLPESEARQRHADAAFALEFHASRAQLCQERAQAAGNLLNLLRRLAEEASGRLLALEVFEEAEQLQV